MGAEIAYGPEMFASYTGFESLKAPPFYSTKSGYGFATLRASPFKSTISEACNYGKQCALSGPVCRFHASPALLWMDEADLLNAAKNGFEFELVGKSTKGQDTCNCVSESA